MPAEARTWAGTTLAERRTTRRQALVDAALELLGEAGPSAVSVRAVCRRARLTERYFYESFGDRDELVVAAYAELATRTHRTLTNAVEAVNTADTVDAVDTDTATSGPRARAEAAVTAFVELLIDRPGLGRTLLLAPLSDPALRRSGAESMPMFTALVHEQLPTTSDPADRAMTATALVGGLCQLFVAYLDGTLRVGRDRLVAHCVRLVLGASALHG